MTNGNLLATQPPRKRFPNSAMLQILKGIVLAVGLNTILCPAASGIAIVVLAPAGKGFGAGMGALLFGVGLGLLGNIGALIFLAIKRQWWAATGMVAVFVMAVATWLLLGMPI